MRIIDYLFASREHHTTLLTGEDSDQASTLR